MASIPTSKMIHSTGGKHAFRPKHKREVSTDSTSNARCSGAALCHVKAQPRCPKHSPGRHKTGGW